MGEQIRHSYISNVVEIRWHGELSKETKQLQPTTPIQLHFIVFHFLHKPLRCPLILPEYIGFSPFFSYPSLCTNMKKQEAEVDKMYSKIFPHFNIALQELINMARANMIFTHS